MVFRFIVITYYSHDFITDISVVSLDDGHREVLPDGLVKDYSLRAVLEDWELVVPVPEVNVQQRLAS